MNSIIISNTPFDFSTIKDQILEHDGIFIDTHLGQNYIERMLKSIKIKNFKITRNYTNGNIKRPCGWKIEINQLKV